MVQNEIKDLSKWFSVVAQPILDGSTVAGKTIYKVTKYISENLTIKATRKRFDKRINKRDRIVEIYFTIGRPNYAERQFIKLCKKAGEPFPIKKLQFKGA